MDIKSALKKSGRDEIATKSIIANTIKTLYGKPIDITSIRLQGKKVLVKTQNSLINSELILLHEEIKTTSLKKL